MYTFLRAATSFMQSSGEEAGKVNPGEVVNHHLTDHVLTAWPFGQINETILNVKLLGIFDMRITRWVLIMWVVVALCLLVFIPLSVRIRRAVNGSNSRWVNLWEVLIEYVYHQIVEPNFGHFSRKVVPYFLSIFFFILFSNLLGLIPGLSTATGNLAVTGALAILTMIGMFAVGFIKHGPLWIFTGIVPHGIPLPVIPLMWAIELLGLFMKPFVLMVRLFANMLSGHIVIIVFLLLIVMFKNYLIAFGSVPGVVFVYALELMVSVVQAYIFTMLSALFISSCMERH